MTNEAFARIKTDQLLKDAGWRLTDGLSVRYEYPLDDGGRADYALFDRQGRALAVLEAKRTRVSPSAGEAQGRRYADMLGVAFVFVSNGEEIWFLDKGHDAHFRKVETVFSQDDLVRRKAARVVKTIDATESEIDRCLLCVGDLLMTEGGDADKLGRCAIWRGEVIGCLHQNHIFEAYPSESGPSICSRRIGSAI